MKQNLSKELRRDIFVNRADGNSPIEDPTTPDVANVAQLLGDIIGGPNRRRAGLRVNGVFFSLESILLASLLVVSIIALRK